MGDHGRWVAHIARLAAGQHGHVARWQLLAIGMPPRTITRWIEAGRLVRVHAGVYAVGYRRVEPIALSAAAVLACGPTAALSHGSALAAWDLARWPGRRPEVTVTGDRRPPGVRVHRSTTLTRDEVRIRLGVRTTSAARTISDIQRRLSDRQLTRAVQDARHGGHIQAGELTTLLGRTPRLKGLLDPAENPTRSPLEDRFRAWLKRHDLPMPTINRRADGAEIDAVFEAHGVVVELDCWTYHGDPISFRTDRAKDVARAAHGLLPLRFTEDRLTDEGSERLRQILDARL